MEQREAGETEKIVTNQIAKAFEGIATEDLEKIIKAAGFIDINIVTKPVSREYEEKWGRSLSIGEYIMSSAINAKKPL